MLIPQGMKCFFLNFLFYFCPVIPNVILHILLEIPNFQRGVILNV